MRTIVLLLAAVALAGGTARAAQPPVTLSVTGIATAEVAPTLATVNASIGTAAPNATDALSQNNAAYARVVDALVRMGIARADITLEYYNVTYNTPSDAPATYRVTRDFRVRVRDITRAGSIVDACMASGATGIYGVSFGIADASAANARAIALAVADARRQADALATAEGLRIVAIRHVELNGAGRSFGGPVIARVNASPPTAFDHGNVGISASVDVTFAAVTR